MWLIVFGFAVATLLLAWLMFGYPIWLRFAGEGKGGAALTVPATLPKISVIVPCWNEEELIVRKYRNLAECDYPADKLEIVFADGGSRDSTVQLLRLRTRDDGRVRVVCCPTPGKVNQLNHVLPDLDGEIVVVTDADARLAPDALKWLAASFAADSELAVAGAYATPRNGLEIERCYWNAQNRVRLLESRISHVSMVIACCYAFRRDLFARFPNDVVADDVYVAVLANTLGHHTTYCVQARVEELRTPRTQWEFLVHKFRKSNAVLREMLRFCYQLPNTVPAWKSILTTRLVQQLLLPVATVFWVALAATLANLGQVDLPMWGFVVLLFGLLAARRAVMSVELPAETEKFGLVTVVVAYVYTMGVLFATALTYLSFQQDSSYSKLSQRSNKRTASKTKRTSRVPPDVPGELIAGNAA